MIETDILVVGGGLAGLRVADLLHHAGRDFQLVEARARAGGRILVHREGGAAYDLGPAWFWPGQPRLAAQAVRFGLQVFEQYSKGDFRFEDAQGHVRQGRGYGAMQGALRLAGGMGALSDALAVALPRDRLHLRTRLHRLERTVDGVIGTCDGRKFSARCVVLALPPRIAAGLTYSPALPPEVLRTMQAVPTWMAGQAKALALFDQPFWRAAGLSGDATSQFGPMVEIHDATPAADGPAALFGFIGVPPAHRQDPETVRQAVAAQLVRLFGAEAARPRAVIVKDWARADETATDADTQPPVAHPRYGLPRMLAGLWDGALHFGGTEVASNFGGYLEGALEAAEAAFAATAPVPAAPR